MRVQEKKIGTYPWWIRIFFWKQKKTYGQVLTPGLIWGRSPKVFAAVALLYGAVNRKKSPIPPALRSLITLRVAQINWCKFCVDINTSTLLKRSGSMEKIDALENWQDSDVFDGKEKAALEYAEAMTSSGSKVTDKMVEQLRKYFDDDGIVELTGLIAFQNLSSKFNNALDIPAQGFCKTKR